MTIRISRRKMSRELIDCMCDGSQSTKIHTDDDHVSAESHPEIEGGGTHTYYMKRHRQLLFHRTKWNVPDSKHDDTDQLIARNCKGIPDGTRDVPP